MKKTLFLAVALSCAAFLLISCGDANSNNGNSSGNKNSSSSGSNTSKPASTPGTTASSGGEIGVPECDAFLKKYEDCLNSNVPEAQRGAMKPGLDAWKKSWKDLAANPQTKPSLVAACNQAEASAKQSMATYKCNF